jgi:hypothetical protein
MSDSNENTQDNLFQLDEYYVDLGADDQITFIEKSEIRKNPFPGLRPFKTSEFQLFHGRDGQAEQLINRLKKNHFLAVIGSSGTGKSSLIRAGLIPQLLGGYLQEGGSYWDIAICRPGKNPVENLASALARVKSRSDEGEKIISEYHVIEPLLSNTIYGILEVNDLLYPLPNPAEKKNLLIIVDQFEELFRFNRDDLNKPGLETQFVNLLLRASADPNNSIYVIITMRSEFLGDTIKFRGLPEAINEGQYLVPQLSRDQIKEVIEDPIKLAGKEISAGLVELLINEIEESKAKKDLDQLPVLQHALMRTYQEAMKEPNVVLIKYDHYRAGGGMEKALANHAEGKFFELSDGENEESFRQKIAKIIFQALTDASTGQKGGRRPTQLGTLYKIAESLKASEIEVNEVIDKFRDRDTSFIMPPVNTLLYPELMIDISHESLIRQWNRLRTWVAEEAEYGKTLLRLSESQKLYEQEVKDLLTEKELAPISKWYHSFAPQAVWAERYVKDYKKSFDYLEESEKAARRKRTVKFISATAVLMLIAVTLFWIETIKQKQKDELSRQSYLNSSKAASSRNDLLAASLFMAEAIKLGNQKDTLLKNSNSYLPIFYLNDYLKLGFDIEEAAFSTNSDVVILRDARKAFHIWNTNTGRFINSLKDTVNFLTADERRGLYITAIGQLLKFWGVDTIVHGFGRGNIIDENFGVVLKIPANIGSFSQGAVSPDGQRLMTWEQRREGTTEAYLWDMKDGKQCGPPLLHFASITDGALNRDANKIFTCDEDSVMRIFKKINLSSQDLVNGDADIPNDLYKTQMEAITGARLNEQKNGIENIPLDEWQELSKNWKKEAETHYNNCRFEHYNYWKHCLR